MSDASLQLDRIISGYWAAQAVYAAAKFGIADLLKDGPRTVDDLAQATSTHPHSLYRLLRALASIGVFREGQPRRFELTPLAEPLRSDVPNSKRALSLMMGGEQFRAWADITYSIQTGRTAFEHMYGRPVFDFLADHPEQARIFDAAMTGIHGREADAVAEAFDFTGIKTLADIGGGNGSQLQALLQRHPHLHGVLFDLPHVIERARPRFEAAGLTDRCTLIAGSFFDSVPPGADAYLMRHIIHDWEEDKALAILRNCRTAMPEHGKLLVVESVIPSGNEPFGGKFLDLVMLLIPGGQERTEPEYRDLFAQAGFTLSRTVPTSSEVSVLEGVKS